MLGYKLARFLYKIHILPNGLYRKYEKQLSKEYRKILDSSFFDKKWYLAQNPDVKASGFDPILHYLEQGWKEGKFPSEVFDGQKYLELNPDVLESGMNPLLHYEVCGKKERRCLPQEIVVKESFPNGAKNIEVFYPENASGTTKRVAVFASFNANSKIEDYVVYYLQELRKEVDAIIFVADNPVLPKELDKIKDLVVGAFCRRHYKYDFGSYKIGLSYAYDSGLLDNAKSLIFCNDSCFGPVYPFKEIFDEMDGRGVDFWGMTENTTYTPHLQSYFVSFNEKIIRSNALKDFLLDIKKGMSYKYYVKEFEIRLTTFLKNNGFSCSSYLKTDDISLNKKIERDLIYNPTRYCVQMLDKRVSLFKIKILRDIDFSYENVGLFLSKISLCNLDLFAAIQAMLNPHNPNDIKLEDGVFYKRSILTKTWKKALKQPSFSVVMPTYNRAYCICEAIDSLLRQTYKNYELLICDDGSTDGTDELIKKRYSKEVEVGKIRYLSQEKSGVCEARNLGLQNAKHEWIAYLDTDNLVLPNFLEVFSFYILKYPCYKNLYSQFRIDNRMLTKDFDYKSLVKGNYIDLGVYVHHSSLYKTLGGFDKNLKRLVDWDLILTYTKKNKPFYIQTILTAYYSDNNEDRISVRENHKLAHEYVRNKHKHLPNFFVSLLNKIKTASMVRRCSLKLIKNSKFFDANWYIEQYPEVKKMGLKPHKHYLKQGWREGKNPSWSFSTQWYLDAYPDVKSAKINPLLHYELLGKAEGRILKAKQLYEFAVSKTISIIIPIYNALDDVKKLFSSIENSNLSKNIDIIVVNDASNEDTSKYLQEFIVGRAGWQLLENEENLGFIKTCNKGMKVASGDIITLLNSDTIINSFFEEKALDCFNGNPDVGIASPISSSSLLFCIELPDGVSLQEMNQRIIEKHNHNYPRVINSEGFCFFIRKEVLKDIGGLDEVYGKGYHEEVDFCHRAMLVGWQCCLIDNLYVYHKRHASFGSEQRDELININNKIFNSRWGAFRKAWTTQNNWKNPIYEIKEEVVCDD